MLKVNDLSFAYPGESPLQFPALQLEQGEQLLILGESGSGKSTLLGLLAGLLSPKQGTIYVGDTSVEKLRGSARDQWRSKTVGLVYQEARLIKSQTVLKNITLQAKLSGIAIPQERLAADLQALGVDHLIHKYPEACSVGERQRVALLRALIHQPALLLADEPTSALDKKNALAVATLLKEACAKRGATLVVVTHDDRLIEVFEKSISL